MTEIQREIGTLYKENFGQLVSLLLSRYPGLSIESAEDAVQDAFAEASARWATSGIPQNKPGWLFTVSKNRSINQSKQSRRSEGLSSAVEVPVHIEEIAEHHLKDARLQMLLACCNTHLAPKTQVILALKYVANLKVKNIALQLGEKEDAIEKMLYRARQKIKDESMVLSSASAHYKTERLSIVHKVIYLIFSEGYKQSGGQVKQGEELCEEALLLNKYLIDSPFCNTETKALQALLLFNIARFPARFDAEGNAIELEYQARALWNRSLIDLARQYLIASKAPAFSPYHLEAAIAGVHCSASRFEETNWTAICKYYEVLVQIYPSPFAQINYATSLLYTRQFEKAYAILDGLNQNPYFNRSYILNTALGKYFEQLGDKEKANVHFKKAAGVRIPGSRLSL